MYPWRCTWRAHTVTCTLWVFKVKTTTRQTLLLKVCKWDISVVCVLEGQLCVYYWGEHTPETSVSTHLARCPLWWCQHRRVWAPPPSPRLPRCQPARQTASALRHNLTAHPVTASQGGEPSLLPWWCVWGTFLWPSWRTPQSTQSSRWPRPDRCTWGRGRLPRWHTASPGLRCRCLSWQLHAVEKSHKCMWGGDPYK